MITRIGDWIYLNMPRPDEQPWLFVLGLVALGLVYLRVMDAWVRWANGEK